MKKRKKIQELNTEKTKKTKIHKRRMKQIFVKCE